MSSIKLRVIAGAIATCAVLMQTSRAADGPSAAAAWIRVSDDLLSGKGISDAFSSATHLEQQKKDTSGIRQKVVFAGQLRTSVIQMKGDSVHLASFPDDEVFCVFVGSLTLTADETKIPQVFHAGDCGFVPKGWAGEWREPDSGTYRELATVPASYSFATPIEQNPPVKGARAFVLEAPKGAGTHQLHSGTIVVEAENAAAEATRTVAVTTDRTIQILKGNLTLRSADKSETFKPGDILVPPKGSNVEMHTSAGYSALNVRAK